jgi:hypothetical protein
MRGDDSSGVSEKSIPATLFSSLPEVLLFLHSANSAAMASHSQAFDGLHMSMTQSGPAGAVLVFSAAAIDPPQLCCLRLAWLCSLENDP